MNLRQLRQKYLNDYIHSDIDSIEANAELDILFEDILNVKKIDFVKVTDRLLCSDNLKKLENIVQQRLESRKPLQYLLGYTYFYGVKILVEEGALIPRSDTEILVEEVIKYIKNDNYKTMADIGVGSGNISIAISLNCPGLTVVSTDISTKAIEIASKNIEINGLKENISLINTSFLNNIDQKFDVIVSNPPYIPDFKKGELQNEVINFEPHNALFTSSENPLENYEHIAIQAYEKLNSGGLLVVEIESDYVLDVQNLFITQG
ncbi:MAG: peptide chain release factor N(5)-glutamine methyltransferase, partial [Vampirovibrionia bacterium]